MQAPLNRETVHFWQDRVLNNLELLHAHYITQRFAPHSHEEFAIGVIEAGGQAFTYQRRSEWLMPAGSIAVINPQVVHTGHAATPQGWVYRMFYPPAQILQQAASQLAGRNQATPFFPQPVIHDPFLMQRLLQLHQLLEDPSTTALERESRLLWTMAQLIIRHAQSKPALSAQQLHPKAVTTIREYLAVHYADSISLEQLAQLVNLSPFHTLRMFRQATGLPPHGYPIQLRINQAKQLLHTQLPLAEVAVQTGFSDQSHLNRHFKRVLGVTPLQYRRQG